MLDHETIKQAEALAIQLIRLADAQGEAGDDEGEAVARSVVDGLCDLLDLGWLRRRRAQA